jgi:hypothetical protein
LQLTGIDPTDSSRLFVWQIAHGIEATGKLGDKDLEAARNSPRAAMAPSAAAATAPAAAPPIPDETSAPAHVPETADELIADSDTSHNRHGGEEGATEEVTDAVFDALCLALEKVGLKHAVVAGVAGKVLALASQRKWSAVRETLTNYLTSPTTVVEVLKFLGEKLGEETLVRFAEGINPAALVLEIAAVHIKLGFGVIEQAHRKGDHDAQLRQYAWAWANQFMRNDYQPTFFATIDEQMELMNTCLRLGVKDANSTRGALEYEMYLLIRDHLIRHYEGNDQAIHSINDALLKQAGVH